MSTNISVIIGSTDFSSAPDETGSHVRVSIGSHTNVESHVGTNFIEHCHAEYGLTFAPTVIDLVHLSLAVFAADKIALRSSAYDSWSRDFKIYFPVADTALWTSCKEIIEESLSFLTGDHWQIRFRERESSTNHETARLPHSKVCLLSGGLDSFIGAADAISENRQNKVICISKYGNGGDESNPQDRVTSCLFRHFGGESFRWIKAYAQPFFPNHAMEDSTRSRSFLFLSHGTALASVLDNGNELIYPENGLISLNVPLTPSRRGSLSTRTTHPHFISLFKQMLQALEINVNIRNPYQLKTKGEMINESAEVDFIKNNARTSCSCSHPSAARFSSHSPGEHCGYCLPCLIRRAALKAAGIENCERYIVDVTERAPESYTKSGKDYRAVRMSLIREHDSTASPLLRVLGSGPLPQENIEDYASVFQRGIAELNAFLERTAQ